MTISRNSLMLFILIVIGVFSHHSISKNLRGYTQSIQIEGLQYANRTVQDQQGYIWFVNGSGLHRYDGSQLKSFSQKSHGLSFNNGRSIHVDSTNTLWIGTRQGFNRYDPQTQSITHIIDNKWPESQYLNVSAIASDQHNNIWLTTIKHQLLHYDINTNTFTQLPLTQNSLSPNKKHILRDIKIDNQGNLWVAANNLLYRLQYDANKQLISSKQYITNPNGQNAHPILRIFIDQQQNLWLGSNSGLYYYHRQSDTLSDSKTAQNTNHQLVKANISDITTDIQGNIWISTWGSGVHIINKQQQQLLSEQQGFNHNITLALDSFTYHDSASDDLQSNLVMELLADNQGIMWIIAPDSIKQVLTSKLAINHFNFVENFNREQTVKPHIVKQQNISLPHKYLNDIFKDSKGYLWFSSFNGLSRYHQDKNTLEYFYYQKGNKNSLPANNINTVIEDSEQNIWVATKLGLAKFNAEQRNFTRIPIHSIDLDQLNHNDTQNIKNYGVNDLTQDKFGALWLAVNNNLVKYQPTTGQVEQFPLTQSQGSTGPAGNTYVMAYDNHHTIWIGKNHAGIGQFDISTNHYSFYSPDQGAPNYPIKDFLVEGKSTVWIASHGGLTLFDGNEQKFEHFHDTADNFSNFNSLVKDTVGNLWIGTNAGLKMFNPKTQVFKIYGTEHGLQNKGIFMPKATFKDPDGSLYFVGPDGVDHFFPEDLAFTPPELNIVITDFLLANRSIPINKNATVKSIDTQHDNGFSIPKAIHFLDELVLNHQQNIFNFEFNAFNYINPNKTLYQYRLKGFNDNWIETDNNNRRATFTNIPAGNYQFEVKATTQNNSWSETKIVNVSILPPWWQTSWAYFIYVFSTVSLLIAVYKWRTKSIIATSRALEQQVNERTKTISELMAQKDKMFANISHEFRTPLTLILTPTEKLINHSNAKPEEISKTAQGIKRNAERLLRMVEQLLEFVKTESNTEHNNAQLYSVKQTIDFQIACFESLFASKKLKVNINDYQDVVLSLKPDSLETILTNLISNAIKYSHQGGSIYIEVHSNQQQLVIKVKDKGMGIAPENQNKIFERFGRVESRTENGQAGIQAGTGIGLALVKELVHANGGQIELQSQLNQGSCFTITLPIDNKAHNQQLLDNPVSDNSKHITALEVSNLSQLNELGELSQLSELSQVHDDIILEPHTPTEHTPQASSNNKPQILVIDDNQELLALIKGVISPQFTVMLADNGKQGIALATQYLPDLVISDVMMPVMDGFEVLKALKSDSLTAHIPVVMLTAKGDSQSRIAGWNNQADEYLAKPFNSQELVARINNILNIRKIVSDRFQQQFNQTIEKTADHNSTTNNQPEQEIDQISEQFSRQIQQILNEHYQDEQLNVETIAQHMHMSQRQLVRKTKSLISMTPNECIRTYRLQKAAEHLKAGMQPSSIAYEVGFASHSYFAACFKAQFGCTPSQYKQG